jgi:hypothetical protein
LPLTGTIPAILTYQIDRLRFQKAVAAMTRLNPPPPLTTPKGDRRVRFAIGDGVPAAAQVRFRPSLSIPFPKIRRLTRQWRSQN